MKIRGMKRALAALFLGLILGLGALAGMAITDSPKRPPITPGGDVVPGMADWNQAEIPPTQKISARDGAPLVYRAYAGSADKVVILVHGSTGSSFDMHKVAQALQAAGATVYSISLRGHGGSGSLNGDVSYVGQLEDDLVDLVRALKVGGDQIKRTLVGFSAGGGFTLKVAGGPQRRLFQSYMAIAPYILLDPNSPEARSNGWVSVGTRRVRVLRILDSIGLPFFQDLIVARYATEAGADDRRTPDYSYRLFVSLRVDQDWRAALARIQAPTVVLLGADDSLVQAERNGTLASFNPHIKLDVIQNMDHIEMITSPEALAAAAAAWRSLAEK